MNKYFIFETLADGMDMNHEIYENLRDKNALSCGHIPIKKANKKFIVPIETLDLSCAYNFVGTLMTNEFIRKDLFDVLEPYLSQEFEFGKVRFNGKILDEGILLWPRREEIPYRGNDTSFCWRCKFCGVLHYQSKGCEYALKCDIEGATIRPLGHTLVVNEKVAKILTSHPQWQVFRRKVRLNEISVFDEPKDGFPMNLSDILPQDERRPPWYIEWEKSMVRKLKKEQH